MLGLSKRPRRIINTIAYEFWFSLLQNGVMTEQTRSSDTSIIIERQEFQELITVKPVFIEAVRLLFLHTFLKIACQRLWRTATHYMGRQKRSSSPFPTIGLTYHSLNLRQYNKGSATAIQKYRSQY